MMRLALALFLAAPLLGAAPLERDLGLGLVYCRVHEVPADLPTEDAVRHHPCVLDIRYVQGGGTAATALTGWLKFHASPGNPVFLLANPGTSAALLAPLANPDSVVGLVILGPSAPDFSPDIAVSVTPADELRAYRALEAGAPIATLVTDNVPKVRQDEAFLAREHSSDSGPDTSAVADAPDSAAPSKAARPRLIDPVLQRAVQLHRALVALKRVRPA